MNIQPQSVRRWSWPRLSFLIASVLVVGANPCRAAEEVAPSKIEAPSDEAAALSKLEDESFGARPYQPLRNLKEGAYHLLDRQSQWTIGVGLAAIISAKSSFDDDVQHYMNRQNRLGGLEHIGNEYLGTGMPGALIGAGLWLYGDLTDSYYEMHAGQAMIETLFITGLANAAMKGSFNRLRPDGSDHYAFPSAHTSTVFAAAMVAHEFYGWKAGVPGFVLSALTAAGRLSDNRHWFSDTLGGATLGILVGGAISRAHLDRYLGIKAKKEPSRITFYPVPEKGGGTLVFRMSL